MPNLALVRTDWTGLTDFTHDYAVVLLGVAGLIGVLALAGFAVWARRTRRPLRPIALAVSMNLALLLNAEGMWVIAVDQLKLPKLFAVLVFAVFEICFLTATSLAGEQYRRTTVFAADGTVTTPGHPGSMLWVAALIAVLSGVIVASNAVTTTEKLLRLAVPCVIFLMWWAALTAAGQKSRRNAFAYSPRRMAERWGWLIPDDDPDLDRMAAERRLDKMALLAYRLHNDNLGARRRDRFRRRLSRMSLRTTSETLTEVQRRVALAVRAEELTSPAAISLLNQEAVPESRPESGPESRPGPRPEPRPEPRLESRPGPGLESRPEPVVEVAFDVPEPRRPAAVTTAAPAVTSATPAATSAASAATTAATTAVSTPRTAAAYRQWLVIWQDMLADPVAGNKALAERHDVAGRTITSIRRAGREGALTPERLAEITRSAATESVEDARHPAYLH
jgi:hypothetical protein